MNTITRPAALVRQGSLKLYATSLRVRDLKRHNFYAINKLDPDDSGPGYQRLLNEGRAKRLAEYLVDGPPSELLSVAWLTPPMKTRSSLAASGGGTRRQDASAAEGLVRD